MKNLSTSLKNLVKILNDGEYHSGSELGKALNISRNAIWKHIKQLDKFDIEIESAQSKGYRLTQPLILLDKNKIKKNINYSGQLKLEKFDVLGSITSTNDYLKSLTIKKINHVNICMTEHQTDGRGRLGRAWHSPFGANIYLSLSWLVAQDVSRFSGLSLAIALSLVQALSNYQIPITIKWPNDILWQNKKLAGILTELNAESHGMTQVVIGIGLNVNMPLMAKNNIDQQWTSLEKILNSYQDRNKIVGNLINHILYTLDEFEQEGFAYFIKQWQQYDHLFGKKININKGKDSILGIAAGVNEHAHLLLQHEDGNITAHSAGETSLHLQFNNVSKSY